MKLLAVVSTLLLVATAANPAPVGTNGGTVNVVVTAVLGADGSLKGTLSSVYTGGCARDLSARLGKLPPADRSKALAALAGPLLAGHLEPSAEIKGLGQDGADLVVTYTLDAPRFALPEGPGKALSVGLPLLAPYDQLKPPAALLPITINHDIAIKLPASTVPLEIPSAFSTITPDAGRYVLWFDLAKEGAGAGMVVKARRELEISGAAAARLAELAEGVAPRDAARLTIVASKPARSSS